MRTFIAKDFTLDSWDELEKYIQQLLNAEINSKSDFLQWLKNKSELDAVIEEDMAWRYIRMTIDTTNEEYTQKYQFVVSEIQPKLSPFADLLNRKLIEQKWVAELESDEAYKIYFRSIRTAIELHREENIPLETEESLLSQEYGAIVGKQTIVYKGEELTMPKAANFLKDPNPEVREEVYKLIVERRLKDADQLNELFSKLVKLRHQIATNAGCTDFREFKFKSLGRFDYTIQDCLNFHDSIEKHFVPIAKAIMQKQCDGLGKTLLKPWDTEVDPDGKPALKPFENGDELLDKSTRIFDKLDSYFSSCLEQMKAGGYLDLDSKTGKAPGGYNYPLYESGIPFIFMNAAGAQRDVVTMVHEGGHAVHSFLSRDLELTGFKDLPSEVAELASMSMELLTMDYWDEFYSNSDDLNRAKREQLEGVIEVLPWIATIDAFQHWIYTNPDHTVEERTNEWLSISKRFGTGLIDHTGFEKARENAWHKQLHLFEVPFYYVEYGIAQIGALGVWKNYREDSKKAIDAYKSALKLGYSSSIPSIYQTAGLKFDFSESTLKDLGQFVSTELEKY